jgi:hypothetical protein
MASAARSAERWIETATAQLRQYPIVTFAEPLTYDPEHDRIWAKLNVPKEQEISYRVHGFGLVISDQKFAAELTTDIAFSAFENGLYVEALKSTKTYFRVKEWCCYGYQKHFLMDVTLKKDNSKREMGLWLGGKNNCLFDPETGTLGLRKIDDMFHCKFTRGDLDSLIFSAGDESVPKTFQLPYIKN